MPWVRVVWRHGIIYNSDSQFEQLLPKEHLAMSRDVSDYRDVKVKKGGCASGGLVLLDVGQTLCMQ